MSRIFACPVCGQPLAAEPRRCFCPAGHSFDRAAEGYVHLMTAAQMRSRSPGDSPEMVRARRSFLDSGSYDFLADVLAEVLAERLRPGDVLFDAGCGEGHYTRRITDRLAQRGIPVHPTGLDISKTAVRMAARRMPQGEFCVGSIYRMPLRDASVHALLNVFSPLCPQENVRVLVPGGSFVYVVPAARHLYELKALAYPEPYENVERDEDYEGFVRVCTRTAERELKLSGPQLRDLFAMTPYFWRTPKEGVRRVMACEGMRVRAAFRICIYNKVENPEHP